MACLRPAPFYLILFIIIPLRTKVNNMISLIYKNKYSKHAEPFEKVQVSIFGHNIFEDSC